jgi:hypothetical protein
MDELVFPTKGFAGVTMRLFDTEQRLWSAYWINSTTGELSLPVYGGFVGDRGELYGEDFGIHVAAGNGGLWSPARRRRRPPASSSAT